MGEKGEKGIAPVILPVIAVLAILLALACLDAPCAERDPAAGNPPSRQSSETENEVSYKIHVTIDGDTLSSIAGQSRIYGSSLKWTLIYLLNREELGKMKIQPAALPITPLPAGLVLALMLPEEARKKADCAAEERPWVVNILSSLNIEEIVPLAIRLIDGGYFAYIGQWNYKDKHWKRLRVGFFADRDTANEQGRKIMEELGLRNFWTVKADWDELNEYAGFFE